MMTKNDALAALYGKEAQRLVKYAATAKHTGEYFSPVFGCGNAFLPNIVFIGEAPGAEETKKSTPFVGKAGRQLDSLLEMAGIARENVFITNAVKYRPTLIKPRSVSNRTPSRKELEAGLPLLTEELTVLRPKIIVTLGNTPLAAALALLKLEPGIIGDVHGQALHSTFNGERIVLFPLYHPASGIYNRSLIPVMEEDSLNLGRLAAAL